MTFPTSFLKEFLLFSCFGFLAFGSSLPVFAQDQPMGQQGTIAPGSLTYQKAQVGTILDLYERLSGKHLIKDVQLDGIPPITLDATGLSNADALKLIEETLLLNGVTLIPVDDKTIKVVTVGANKNPRSEGIKLYANATDLPKDDQVVSVPPSRIESLKSAPLPQAPPSGTAP